MSASGSIPLAAICIDAPNYRRVAKTTLPVNIGGATVTFDAYAYSCPYPADEVIALQLGAHETNDARPLVRLHSGCTTGDALGSLRCDCRFQLERALQSIRDEGSGVLIYMPSHEGRGIGLANKLRAYELQDGGRDTVDANLELGFAPDDRSYAGAIFALRDLGVHSLRLMSNNPAKIRALKEAGFNIVHRERIDGGINAHNRAYVLTKTQRLHHLFLDLNENDG